MRQSDIAKLAGVDRSTISRVLSNTARISETKKQKILKIIKETGYQPHAAAQSLALAKNLTIGVCLFDPGYIEIPTFGAVVSGILGVVNAEEYSLIIAPTKTNDPEGISNVIRLIQSKRVDGAIIYDDSIDESVLLKLKKMKFPLVLVNRKLRSGNSINSVCCDFRKGAEIATNHLIELGHRRIGIVTESSSWYVGSEKQAGYKDALANHGIKIDDGYIFELEELTDLTYRTAVTLNKFLSMEPGITALIFPDDVCASGALRDLLYRGYKVPNDISVVTYNDAYKIDTPKPRLTAINVNYNEIGKSAARLLFENMRSSRYSYKSIMVSPELIIKESTGEIQIN